MNNKTKVLEALKHSNIFLTGGAGVGKSYLTNKIIEDYNKKGKQVVALGSTGVSAVNIGGFTIHSFFAFGLSSNFDELMQNDKRNKKRLKDLEKILKNTELIIIDEISMVSSTLLDMISFRLSTYNYIGKILFVGDFFQLPPIQKSSNDIFGEKLFAFESMAWERFSPFVLELDKMKRTSDIEFTNILSKIRKGICDNTVLNYINSLKNNSIPQNDPTYLYGTNFEVEQTNHYKLSTLKNEETILFSDINTFGNTIHPKRLDSWKKFLPISEQLTLKIDVPILFTVNKWGKFVNGERGILRKIEDGYLVVEKDDKFIRVEQHEFELLDIQVQDDGTLKSIVLASLSQFPVRLAYAVTIHKSQGMSIDNLVCNVDKIFAPSQFYVAISRATEPKNLAIEYNQGNFDYYLNKMIRVDNRVKEYYERIKDETLI